MKKLLLVLTMMFISLSLSACGNVIDETQQTSQTSQTQQTQQTPLSVEIPNGKVTEDGIKVWEFDGYSVTIDDIEPNAENGFDIEIIFENGTGAEVSLVMSDIIVNDVNMIYAVSLNETIRSDETKHMMLTIPTNLLGEGVLLTDIELSFMIYDSSYEAQNLVSGVTIYPYGEEKSGTYDNGDRPCVVELLNDDVATVELVGYNFDKSVEGFYAHVYIYNKSHDTINVINDSVVINNFEVTAMVMAEVEAYTGVILSSYIPESTLYEMGVNSIEDIDDIYVNGEVFERQY